MSSLTGASNEASLSIPHDEDNGFTETPLLSDGARVQDNQESILKRTQPLASLVLYFMTIHFLLAFCEIILVAPLIKLFENSLCLSYFDFPAGGVGEAMCKINEIQRPLATIRGWKSMFDTFPGTLEIKQAEDRC